MIEEELEGHQVLHDRHTGRWWVTSPDGDTIARFHPVSGMDIHHTTEEQQRTGTQCLQCTHEPTSWEAFADALEFHYGLDLRQLTL